MPAIWTKGAVLSVVVLILQGCSALSIGTVPQIDSGVVTAIISTSAFTALLTLTLTRLLDRKRSRQQGRGYLCGIQLEIAYAEECADAYITDVKSGHSVWAPNYRTVTESVKLYVPWLTAAGFLEADEANQLFRFYTRAVEINKSLDALADLTSALGYHPPPLPTGKTREEQETGRCSAKCSNLLGKVPDQLVGSTAKAWEAATRALARIT